MGINQQGNYLMKNLKESANLIKGIKAGWKRYSLIGLLAKRAVETEYTIKVHMFYIKCRY